ncbi:MAG: hypothetical protein K2L96_00690 [Muribaculaceae bacterium]|nr:hypothetical protein [Muribaculaceae bacterium]
MNKLLACVGAIGLALFGPSMAANAQSAGEEPIIEFHTNLYDLNGDMNAFHFLIGAKVDTYIDVDCGFGPVEVEVGQAVFNTETGSIDATTVSCQVNQDGIVRIYGDASLIDYLDFEGCYISEFKWPNMTELQVLNLCHNELESLDLSHMKKLEALYLDDNPMSKSPLVVGSDKPYLAILMMNMVGNVAPSFNISDYPDLRSFSAFSTPSITTLDPTGCPKLIQLSADGTSISSIDTSKNPSLMILNVSDTKVSELDLSHNPYLTELYCSHNGAYNNNYKISQLDLSKLPNLVRLFVAGNSLQSVDLSKLPYLQTFSAAHNELSTLNIDSNPDLFDLDVAYNNMNFVTLPADRSTFTSYIYVQNPFPLEKKYAVGTELDFSDKVNRPESTTLAALYIYKEENPSNPEMLDDSHYKWNNGKLTLLTEQTDSVFVRFSNSALPEYDMTTSKFLVKNAADLDKPSATMSLKYSPTVRNYSLSVGLAGATEAAPRKFYVDFGNGTLQEFTATSNLLPATANVNASKPTGGNNTITIYMPEGEQLTALGIDNQRLISVDTQMARAMQVLSITNCGLGTIDLAWNRCLSTLNLSGNNLSEIDLTEVIGSYNKNIRTLNLSNNKLTAITNPNPYSLIDVDYSHNLLESVITEKMNAVKTLNVSGNKLSEIDLRDLEAIETLDVSGNMLTSITLLPYLPLKSLDLSMNRMTFANLPAVGCIDNYVYAPQQVIEQPEKAPVVSLYHYLFDTDAGNTVFTWYMADTNTPVAEGNIRENNGRFFFTNPDLGKVYCTLSNAAFPDFAGENIMRTSIVETAPMPTHVFATFTPKNDGKCTLILAGHTKGTAVYVDWTGEGDMVQCILEATGQYTIFEGDVMGGKQAKCYSYGEDDGVSVFSISDIEMTQLDGSMMKSLISFMVYDSRIRFADLKLPVSPSLQELALNYCSLPDVDFLKNYPELRMLSIQSEGLGKADISMCKKLQSAVIANSNLTEVKLDNPVLWNLDLGCNDLESLDLSRLPSLIQLTLIDNRLSALDLSMLKSLREIKINNNRFTLATLPLPNPDWYVYQYSNQALMDIEVINGQVDLSSQAMVNGTPTVYRWFIDSPYLDENNELAGEELIEGEEYTLDKGVTTFLSDFDNVMCVMTNPVFPEFYQLTQFVDVRLSGIDNITIDESEPEYYNLQGIRVANPHGGIYIRRQGRQATKVYIR